MTIRVSNNDCPIVSATFDRSGNTKNNPDLIQKHVKLNENYYRNELNKKWGPAELIAYFEILTAGLLHWLIKSPATFTNAVTSVGELIQVRIANTKRLGDPLSVDPVKRKIAESRREGATAWVQFFAGLGGLLSLLMDTIKGGQKEVHELSFFKKLGLSTTSFLSTVFMLFGGGEKNLIATLSKNNSTEDDNERMNAHSDFRCFAEWATMTIFPWVTSIKPVRTIVEIVIPLLALREGIGHFVREGINSVFSNSLNKELPHKLKNILKKIFFTNEDKHDHKTHDKVPGMFACKWFLGTEKRAGFRTKYIIPILRFFGCNPPHYNLDENSNIVSEFYETKKEKVTEEDNAINNGRKIGINSTRGFNSLKYKSLKI